LPSQPPVIPQLAAPSFLQLPVGSEPLAATGAHVPSDVFVAHDMHVPPQLVRQHTPWAQKPVAHSEPSLQVAPGDLSPHEPPTHTAGATQSPSAVHVALHAAAPHLYGAHDAEPGVTHVPAPSHVDAGVNVVVPAGQLASLHGAPCGYFWQAPFSHMPLVPHVDDV